MESKTDQIKRQLESLLILRAERNLEILKRRANGETLQAIGDSMGLTRERVRQVIEKARRAA